MKKSSLVAISVGALAVFGLATSVTADTKLDAENAAALQSTKEMLKKLENDFAETQKLLSDAKAKLAAQKKAQEDEIAQLKDKLRRIWGNEPAQAAARKDINDQITRSESSNRKIEQVISEMDRALGKS